MFEKSTVKCFLPVRQLSPNVWRAKKKKFLLVSLKWFSKQFLTSFRRVELSQIGVGHFHCVLQENSLAIYVSWEQTLLNSFLLTFFWEIFIFVEHILQLLVSKLFLRAVQVHVSEFPKFHFDYSSTFFFALSRKFSFCEIDWRKDALFWLILILWEIFFSSSDSRTI